MKCDVCGKESVYCEDYAVFKSEAMYNNEFYGFIRDYKCGECLEKARRKTVEDVTQLFEANKAVAKKEMIKFIVCLALVILLSFGSVSSEEAQSPLITGGALLLMFTVYLLCSWSEAASKMNKQKKLLGEWKEDKEKIVIYSPPLEAFRAPLLNYQNRKEAVKKGEKWLDDPSCHDLMPMPVHCFSVNDKKLSPYFKKVYNDVLAELTPEKEEARVEMAHKKGKKAKAAYNGNTDKDTYVFGRNIREED
jgi:hypothetical protein